MTVTLAFLKLTTRNMSMAMTMSSIRPNRVEVVTSVQCQMRWTQEQSIEIDKLPNEQVSYVSLVAIAFNENVTSASQFLECMRRIKQIEGALGRKTLENEVHMDTVLC